MNDNNESNQKTPIGEDKESLLFPHYVRNNGLKNDAKENLNKEPVSMPRIDSVYVEPSRQEVVPGSVGISKSEHKKVIVIGAGIGGLATACVFAKKGYSVTVIEKNNWVGGRIFEIEKDGFRFTQGPSWFIMPEVFEYFFSLFGEKMKDYFDIQRLSPAFRAFFKDTQISADLRGDRVVDAKIFENYEPGAESRYEQYLSQIKNHYDYLWNEKLFDISTTSGGLSRIQQLLNSTERMVNGTSQSYVQRFFKSDIIQKILQYQHIFLGGTPFQTPASPTILTNIEKSGVFYPNGGMVSVAKAFEKLAKKCGVVIKTGEEVQKILVDETTAIGVETEGGTRILADIVISNADMHHTETVLLNKESRSYDEWYWKGKTLSPTSFIMHLGLKDKAPSLAHHTILFPRDWNNTFNELFRTKMFPEDPIIYIHCPSKTDENVSPKGMENISISTLIPAGMSYDKETLNLFKEKILRVVEADMNVPMIKERIVTEEIYGADNFISDYNSFEGSAFGLAYTAAQSGSSRPDNQSKKIPNLYYVGANTEPGIGMPFAIIGAIRVYKKVHSLLDRGPIKEIV